MEESSLFERAMAMDPDEALRMAMDAQGTEEKRFYAYLAEMLLQRRDLQEFQAHLDQNQCQQKDPGR